jgi:O-antigen chain-terminating methyltransferase
LRPGGALIFETPNPNNVNVATSGFYLDPTHRAPLPPLLLEFMLSRAGFIEVEIRYLNPTPRYAGSIAGAGTDEDNLLDDLNRAFFGAQDYAVVAYRPGTS